MRERHEPGSNANAVREEQSQKHSAPRISTEAGIYRDCRDAHAKNDPGPIIFKHDISANVNFDRKMQPRKQSCPRDSINAETVKDVMG
jgi:hypothetical protein